MKNYAKSIVAGSKRTIVLFFLVVVSPAFAFASYTFSLAGSAAIVTPVAATGGPILINEVLVSGNPFLEWSTDNGVTFSLDWDSTIAGVQMLPATTASSINLTPTTGPGSSITLGDTVSPASNIFASVSLGPAGSPANNSLIIDDRNSTHAAGNYDFFAVLGGITGPGGAVGGINFTSFGPVGSYTIMGGPAANTFNIHSTFNATIANTSITGGIAADTANVLGDVSPNIGTPLTIDLGGGANTVHVGNGNLAATILSPVKVTDTGGTTSLFANDQNDTTHPAATLDDQSGDAGAPFQLAGLSGAPIKMGSGVNAVTVNGGTNGAAGVTYNINKTPNSTATTINAKTNTDTVKIMGGNVGGLDNLRYLPTGALAGHVVNDDFPSPDVTFSGVEDVQLIGIFADGDGVRMEGTIGNDAIVLSRGATIDSGIFSGTMDTNNATGGGPFAMVPATFFGVDSSANDQDVGFFNPGGDDSFTFNGNAENETIVVQTGEAGGVQVRDTVTPNIVIRAEIFNTKGLQINSGDGDDTVSILGDAIFNYTLPVGVDAGPGATDSLSITGRVGLLDNLRYLPTGLGAGTVINDGGPMPSIGFAGTEALTLNSQLADGDGVRVDGTVGSDSVSLTPGATSDSGIFTGTMNGGAFPMTPMTYFGVDSAANDQDVNFFNPGGSDSFSLIGTGAAETFDIGIGEAGGVQVRDTVGATIIARPEVFNVASITISGQGSDDIFNVGSGTMDSLNSSFILQGGAGTNDSVNFNDQSDGSANVYTLTNNTLSRSGSGSVSFATVEAVTLNAGTLGDTINLGSQFATVTEVVNAGGGNDTVNVGNAGTLDALLGPLTINGNAGTTDAINFNDPADGNVNNYTVTPTTMTRTGGPTINYTTAESLTVNGDGNGAATGNFFNVSPSLTTAITVNAGAPVPPANPGDQLLVNFTGTTGVAFLPGGVGAGTFTFTSGHQPVSFTGIEISASPTATTVTSSTNPSVFGQPVTFTATVTTVPPGGTPVGTVSFNIDGNLYCVNTPLNGVGVATCTQAGLPALPAGLRNVVAQFNANPIFGASVATVNQTVNKAAATIAITSDTPDPSFVNQPYAVTFTVTAVSPGAGTPTGNVNLFDGAGGPVCTATVAAGTCNVVSTTVGNKWIRGAYLGDANFQITAVGSFIAFNELESNNTAATAMSISGTNFVVDGAVSAVGDQDWYRLNNVPAGAKAWFYTDTGVPIIAGTHDSVIDIYAADGTTLIENDDDDGTGNGGFGTVVTNDSSSIAGRTLTTGGTYYFRVTGFGTDIVNPYRMFVNISNTAVAAEAETNDTSATANPIITLGQNTGIRSGTIGTASDIDYYSVQATAGNSLFISMDGDPARTGTNTLDGVVTLFAPDGTTQLISVNSSAGGTNVPNTSEGFNFFIGASGTYYVRVSGAGGESGRAYNLMVNAVGGQGTPHTVNLGISGTVRNGVTNAPIAGVNVVAYDTGLTPLANATTNAAGSYTIVGPLTGTVIVIPSSSFPPYYDPTSRTYVLNNTNITGADFLSFATVGDIPRTVTHPTQYVTPGAAGSMPVILNSQGNEASVAYSIIYDINPFAQPPTFVCGANAPGCTITQNNSVLGRVGVTIVPAGGVFTKPDGSPLEATEVSTPKEIARINFQTLSNNLPSTDFITTGSPTAALALDAANNHLLQVFIQPVRVVFAQGIEGDVTGRNAGNGVVDATDVVQVRRFVTGLDTPVSTHNEFQRADVAPAATKGNGTLDATDVIQARRFGAGLDTPQSAGGPGAAGLSMPEPERGEAPRGITIGNATGTVGTRVSVPVDITATGDEVATSFAVRYDADALGAPSVDASDLPEGMTLTANTDEEGLIRILVDGNAPFKESKDALTMVRISFDILGKAPSGESMLAIEGGIVSDANAAELMSTFRSGAISIAGPNPPADEDRGRKSKRPGSRNERPDMIEEWLNNSTVTIRLRFDLP